MKIELLQNRYGPYSAKNYIYSHNHELNILEETGYSCRAIRSVSSIFDYLLHWSQLLKKSLLSFGLNTFFPLTVDIPLEL